MFAFPKALLRDRSPTVTSKQHSTSVHKPEPQRSSSVPTKRLEITNESQVYQKHETASQPLHIVQQDAYSFCEQEPELILLEEKGQYFQDAASIEPIASVCHDVGELHEQEEEHSGAPKLYKTLFHWNLCKL